MEQYRSGHNGHDWKSCVPQKGTEGSNPSCSAIKKNLIQVDEVLFYSVATEGFENLMQHSGGVLLDAGWTASTL